MIKGNFSKVPVAPTRSPPTSQIERVEPHVNCDIKKCEISINIGLFFDGTNNNKDRDAPFLGETNIARLFDQYNENRDLGYHRVYVPGVGTRFPEIGEDEESALGNGYAFGCEERVIFGMLKVINFIHRQCFKNDIFSGAAVLALCRNGAYVKMASDRAALAKFGEDCGLLEPEVEDGNRRDFLMQQSKILEEKMKIGKPRVVECFVDVFGFSRGAAEARVFCSWLNELLIGGRLAGVPLHFRFVGIIDTVASAGFWSGTLAFATKSTGGHGAWASANALNMPSSVKNCVHMVAMHELRRNFPLDAIGIDGKMQKGWVQFAYPGAHSDVGGGYRPGELGLAVGDDSQKLSQIPLNHMLECAIVAGAPMKKPIPIPGEKDLFAVNPKLVKAFDDFILQATLNPRPIYEWLQPYLNWRWQVRDRYDKSNQVMRANETDKKVLISFNRSLIADADAMQRFGAGRSVSQLAFGAMKTVFQSQEKGAMARIKALEPEARDILALAQKAKATPASFASFFDNYVHDSLAGFNSPFLEGPGYWRYRRVFLGTDNPTIATTLDGEISRRVA